MKKIGLIILFVIITINSRADDSDDFRKRQIKFISELYSSGRYFDTIAETKKLQLREKNPAAEYFIFSNYFLAGEYATVINNYTPDLSSEEMQIQSLLLLSGSFMKKEMYMESYKILQNYEYSKLPDKYIFNMFLRKIEPLILTFNTESIDEEIKRSGIYLKDEYNFIKLSNELQLYKKEGLKSPGYAALMSAIIPGSGQCYAGYPLHGLISILSVAATAAGGFYTRDQGGRSLSNTLFFFSGLFYGGTIYGAYNSAEAANYKSMQERHRSIISQYGSYNPGIYIEIESVFN